MTNRLKSVGSAMLSILPLVLFIMGCVWVLLFPAISVTTGELKPRGMYVDEHALLVHSQLFKNPVLEPASYINDTRDLGVCDKLDNPLISCSILKNLSVSSAGTVNISHNTDITQIILRPYRPKIIYESTVLLFHYIPGLDCMEELVVRLVSSIQKHLHNTQWMARNVVILVIPSQHHHLLDAWLRQTHAPSAQQLQDLAYALVDGSTTAALGTIREAYVLDLTQEKACHSDSYQYAFSSLTLLHDGLNGILPNMDMVSFPLAIHKSGVLRTHSEVCSVQLSSDVSATLVRLLKAYPQSGLGNMWVAFAASLWAEVNSTPALRLYTARLLGLACSMHAQISPALPNQHTLFLKYNIDAITLRPVALSGGKGLKQQSQQRGPRSRSGRAGPPQEEQQVFGPEKLLEVLLSLLYVSNNLHEELHHSHFYYLLMGSDSFVGIGEYGFTAAAFLLALLALFHQLCALCGDDICLNAVYCVTAATLPMLVALSALTEPSASSTLSPIWTPVQQYITTAVQAYAPEGWQAGAALTLGYVTGLGTLLLWHSSCRRPHDAGKGSVVEASTGATVSSQGSTEVLLPKLSVVVLSLLLSLSWMFAQNFSLAVVLAISILPTLLWGYLAVRRRGDAARVTVHRLGLAGLLALSAALHSPPGLYALDRAFTAVVSVSGTSQSVLLDALLQAWCHRGVLAFPAFLLLYTLASYYSVSCALLWLY